MDKRTSPDDDFAIEGDIYKDEKYQKHLIFILVSVPHQSAVELCCHHLLTLNLLISILI